MGFSSHSGSCSCSYSHSYSAFRFPAFPDALSQVHNRYFGKPICSSIWNAKFAVHFSIFILTRCCFASLPPSRFSRLQNSSYFCVFKYARAVKQKVSNEPESRERDWGETPYGRVRLARFARARLLPHTLPISLLILRKKNDCFAVYRFRGACI